MSCSPREKGNSQQNEDRTGSCKIGRRERVITVVMALAAVATAFRISLFWTEDWQDPPKDEWTQMKGNDGKFWKGTPDGSVYADIEGAELREYFQYAYDRDGRLSKINTFRPHTNYEDVWVLSNEETYEYDAQGRISRRQEVQGNTRKAYEYTSEGYTETESSSNQSHGRIAGYDSAGNRIYFRNAVNYRFPHVTTFEYDEKNRLVRKTLEIEGKEPYGVPTYVTYTAEYDEDNFTSVETEYDSQGEAVYIWHSTYDESWSKTGSVWYAPEKVPEEYGLEECEAYYTRGYWRSVSDGKIMEEMENEPWKDTRNNSEYTAYDYDGSGNCILELKVYSASSAYLYRYVYDSKNRLTEQYHYNMNEVKRWERRLCDGSSLTLQVSDDQVLRITRTAPDGSLINCFIYGEWDVEIQQTSEGSVSWQLNPSLILADKEARPDETGTAESEGAKPGQTDQDSFSGSKEIFYIVKRGDCLWSIAEEFFGDGRKYRDIYRWNRNVIGDDPGLILQGMRLYLDVP